VPEKFKGLSRESSKQLGPHDRRVTCFNAVVSASLVGCEIVKDVILEGCFPLFIFHCLNDMERE